MADTPKRPVPRRGPGRPPAHEGRLGAWIRTHRRQRAEVAEELGITRKYLDHLCREERRPSLRLADRIVKLTDGAIDVAYLVGLPR